MSQKIYQYKNKLTIISGVLIILGGLAKIAGSAPIEKLAFILASLIASIPIITKALQALRMKAFSIELLVTIAVIGALIIGEYTESAVVTFLFLFGDYLEVRTLEKTRSSLKKLVELAPQKATIRHEDGGTQDIPVDEVKKGDDIVVRSGGKIPVDGIITSGKASINEAAITGESVPVTKEADDRVFSGTTIDSGYLEITAEKVGDDTTFAKIIELVEDAQDSKSKAERFLDKFASIYTPAIIILSVLVLLISRNFHLAITFLVIACPGALVIGAPVSNVAGIGNGAKNGVLIKGSEIMNTFSKVDTLVFDKTGTLTKGKPEVTDVHALTKMSTEELLKLTAAAESISEHHLGKVIVKEAQTHHFDINTQHIENGQTLKGRGITADINGLHLAVGNRKLMKEKHIQISSVAEHYAVQREKLGNSAVFVGIRGELAGIISIADQIRPDAKQALNQMRSRGIRKIIMLTGDNQYTAEAVSNALNLNEFHAELMPEDKVSMINQLKNAGHTVAMAGDGINDAPAIAAADIGLAMGEGGTDVSMETADVVLMADKLMQLSHAYSLSKATTRNMKENIAIAVIVVLFLLSGVLMGTVHLASGMFVHEASVLVVILNAIRLISFNSHKS